MIEKLSKAGIEIRPMFTPLDWIEIYRKYGTRTSGKAKRISDRGLSLPTFYGITDEEINRVCEVLNAS